MEGIPEEDMIAHERKLASNNQNNSNSKKSKSSGSAQYGELTLEQIQQQMEARKTVAAPYSQDYSQDYYGYNNYPQQPYTNTAYYQNGFPPPPQQPQNFGYAGG